MLQEQLELENACALTNTLEIKDFSWFQFHVFTFATVGIAPRSVDPEADQCRSEIWEGRGHSPRDWWSSITTGARDTFVVELFTCPCAVHPSSGRTNSSSTRRLPVEKFFFEEQLASATFPRPSGGFPPANSRMRAPSAPTAFEDNAHLIGEDLDFSRGVPLGTNSWLLRSSSFEVVEESSS
jgi:hypothetical protein